MPEIGTYSLSGGRRLARPRASSDPTDTLNHPDLPLSPTRWRWVTRNPTSLTNVRKGVVTITLLPDGVPAGTDVVISPDETIVNVADTPLKVTAVAPDRSVPYIVSILPIGPPPRKYFHERGKTEGPSEHAISTRFSATISAYVRPAAPGFHAIDGTKNLKKPEIDFDTLIWPPNDHLNWPPEDKAI